MGGGINAGMIAKVDFPLERPMKTLPMLLLFAAAFSAIAQPVESRGTDTNELNAAITELLRQVPVLDVAASPMFINAPDQEARLARAAQRRQELIAAREKIPQRIEPSSTGAIARFGAMQVNFGSDAMNGILLVTPDGLQLRSRVVGLCYWSESKTVMLAELKRSTGQIVDAKTVRYQKRSVQLQRSSMK